MDIKKPRRAVKKCFIHCSAASRPDITAIEIDRWHKQRGWSEIGYHFFVKTDGTLQRGRDLEKIPAAQAGHNTFSIAICLNGLVPEDFTEAQFDTLRKFCKHINSLYDGKITFHGHCEVSAKTCPVFDYKKVLNLNKAGQLGL